MSLFKPPNGGGRKSHSRPLFEKFENAFRLNYGANNIVAEVYNYNKNECAS